MSYSEQLLEKIESNDFTDLNILLNKALANDDAEMLASLAEELYALGFSDLAAQVYRKLLAQFPKEDLFKIYLAEILLNDGHEDDALSLLYAINQESSAYLNSLLILADYYQSESFTEAAEQKLLEAYNLAPDEPVIWFALAELYYAMGEFTKALQFYEQLNANDIKELSGVLIDARIANTYANLGEYEMAADLLDQLTLKDLNVDAQYEAGLIYLQTKRYRDSIAMLESVVELNPDYVNAYSNLARAYQAEHNNEKVLQIAQLGLGYNKFDETLYDLGAKAAANLNELATAKELLKAGLKINKENAALRLSLSNLYLQLGEDQLNIDLFLAIADDEIEDQAHWNLAQSYDHLEQYAEAKQEYLLAYRSFADNLDFLRQLIYFLQEDGDQKLEKTALTRYLALEPDDFEMQSRFEEL